QSAAAGAAIRLGAAGLARLTVLRCGARGARRPDNGSVHALRRAGVRPVYAGACARRPAPLAARDPDVRAVHGWSRRRGPPPAGPWRGPRAARAVRHHRLRVLGPAEAEPE